ncbi:MAG: hypothetical protein ACRC2Y_04935 [Aeromonas veronii]
MINGHLKNYAKRRGFEIEVSELDGQDIVWLYELGQDSEPMIVFTQYPEGLQLRGFVYNRHLKEDFPALITTETKMKEVLNYLHNELKGKE